MCATGDDGVRQPMAGAERTRSGWITSNIGICEVRERSCSRAPLHNNGPSLRVQLAPPQFHFSKSLTPKRLQSVADWDAI